RYKNYVADGTDFPLSQFTARNSAATQAVGYGKTLMLWHMLRVELGDELFLEGLRQFYEQYKFRRASFADIERLFSGLSGVDLTAFFDQWVHRTGAPELSVDVQEVNGNRARIMFAQTQFGDPYLLKVPVALYYEGESEPQLYDINLSQKTEGFFAPDYDRLQAVLVDPYFDVFRTLDREETPPSVGELFGASEINFILPNTNREQWTELAQNFGANAEYELIFADGIDSIPADKPAWILGRDNPWAATVTEAASVYGVTETDSGLTMAGSEIGYDNRTTLILGRHPDNPELAIGALHIDDMVALPGTIEKLPHYGRYSYVSFTGAEPTIDIRGEWESTNSPLQWVKPNLVDTVAWDSLPTPPSIAELPPKYLPEQLARHTNALTMPALEGRGLESAGLDEAAYYIAEQFRAAGLQPVDGTYIQHWQEVRAGMGAVELANVVGMIPGINRDVSAAPVVIGAHYDHLGIDPETGQVYSGADDNASGVAVLIEVASKLSRAFTPQRPILFVAFSGEEAGLIGSEHFVNNPPGAFAKEDLFAMINLDAVGRLEGKPIQVFATDSAYEWPFMAQGIGFTIGVPSEFPSETIASGDHVSFLNAGIPAIHVFSGVHLDYHQPTDTADKLDLNGMSDVALWVEEAMMFLGDRVDPLRVNLENARQPIAVSGATTEREASLGTVPDFAYGGAGIRISGVTPRGAAEEAGLVANDVLLSYNGEAIDSLQSYSNFIRGSAPGDVVTLDIQRGEETFSVQVTLKAR
ncbi:MAG: M20/M25/M40 family metallo-hydrolase, partial [Pseudomonadales bacterium]|nr:M20/M25/M40 family metallo-hydrolase [Pseudomonadales bacterium]